MKNVKKQIYDEAKMVDDTFTMVIQVNGKVRGKIEITNESEEEIKKLAFEVENVKNFTEGKEIVKDAAHTTKQLNNGNTKGLQRSD